MKMPVRAAIMSPNARKNRITRREYKSIFCFNVREAACFFNSSSSRSTWQEDRNSSIKDSNQTCLLPRGWHPSDLQPVEDVLLLQLGLLLSQRTVVPAGERYHAVVVAGPAPCRHGHPSYRSQPVNHSQSRSDVFHNRHLTQNLHSFPPNWPCHDANETKRDVEDDREEVRQRDVVGEVRGHHQCVFVEAVKQVGELHEPLRTSRGFSSQNILQGQNKSSAVTGKLMLTAADCSLMSATAMRETSVLYAVNNTVMVSEGPETRRTRLHNSVFACGTHRSQ